MPVSHRRFLEVTFFTNVGCAVSITRILDGLQRYVPEYLTALPSLCEVSLRGVPSYRLYFLIGF